MGGKQNFQFGLPGKQPLLSISDKDQLWKVRLRLGTYLSMPAFHPTEDRPSSWQYRPAYKKVVVAFG